PGIPDPRLRSLGSTPEWALEPPTRHRGLAGPPAVVFAPVVDAGALRRGRAYRAVDVDVEGVRRVRAGARRVDEEVVPVVVRREQGHRVGTARGGDRLG